MKELEQTVAEARTAIAASRTIAELEQAKSRFLGKSGAVTELLKGLGKLAAEERPQAGAAIKRPQAQNECLGPAPREASLPREPHGKPAAQADHAHPPGRGRPA